MFQIVEISPLSNNFGSATVPRVRRNEECNVYLMDEFLNTKEYFQDGVDPREKLNQCSHLPNQ